MPGEASAESGAGVATDSTVQAVVDTIDRTIARFEGDDHVNLVTPTNTRMVVLGRVSGWVPSEGYAPRAAVTELTMDRTTFRHGMLVPEGEMTTDSEYIVFQKGDGESAKRAVGVTSKTRDWTEDGRHWQEVKARNEKGKERRFLTEQEALDLQAYIESLESVDEEQAKAAA